MFRTHDHRSLKKTRSRKLQRKLKKSNQTTVQKHSKAPSFIERFENSLTDLRNSGPLIQSYTIEQLEPICHQLAIQQMSSTDKKSVPSEICPLICLFCQNLIHEPLTLHCGHTYCEQCVRDEQISANMSCPRCPEDIEGQIQSSVVYARQLPFVRNHFLKQIFERSELLRDKYQSNMLYHKGKQEFRNGNFDTAIDIFSKILEKDETHHLALYGRAKSLMALGQLEHALNDANRVVSLKPQWPKGFLCRSEIYFALNQFKSALISSLRAMVMNPEDPFAKPVMAQHLHAVLHNNDSEETMSTIQSESERNQPMDDNDSDETITTSSNSTDERTLTICKSNQCNESSTPCFCRQLDYKNLQPRDFECSICVNLFWFPITTPCGHVVCRECLIRAVDNTHIQCPICKSSLATFFPLVIECHVNRTELISKMIETYFPNEHEERRQINEQENRHGTPIPHSILTNTNNTPPPPATMTFEIPIFVCVLALPCCSCPLHVFEPRYRLMMRRALESQTRTFGMCTYDPHIDNFSDYGTLLYIDNLVYTPDGRSIVETTGQRRFRVIERGSRDGYCTAKVELIRDNPIEQHEFDDLFELSRTTYNRVKNWYNRLDPNQQALIRRQLGEYPACDDLTTGSLDGPRWTWIMLNLLPISTLLQYTALASQSFRIRLQIINDVINYLDHQQDTA